MFNNIISQEWSCGTYGMCCDNSDPIYSISYHFEFTNSGVYINMNVYDQNEIPFLLLRELYQVHTTITLVRLRHSESENIKAFNEIETN